MTTIKVKILSSDRILLGLDYQLLMFADEWDDQGEPIIFEWDEISLGLIFFSITISSRRG
jgi:hypothetical protein